MNNEKKANLERLLILCVDRDNDIGRKTNMKTPIIGKKENLNAATNLLLADPEEADANAMFEAIKIFNKLSNSESKNQLEISTIAGSEKSGLDADRKLVKELSDVLTKFNADSLILVTDGFSDEDIIPLIQSRKPITSVKRVVVKHSETIEETAMIFTKYLRMIIEDPRYSRIFLGLPGVLLIAIGILAFLGIFIQYDIGPWATMVALIIVGSFLVGKGFGFGEKFSRFISHIYHLSLIEVVSTFSLFTGILIIGLGFYQAWPNIYLAITPLPSEMSQWLEIIPIILGSLIGYSLTMVIIGICIIFIGRAISYLLEPNIKFWRTISLVVVFAWSWTIFNEMAHILINPSVPPNRLIYSILVGIVIIIASGLTSYFLGKKFGYLFEKKGDSDFSKDE